MQAPPLEEQPIPQWRWRTPLLIAIVFFAALFPTLSWMPFSNTMENLNVATVLEMHRGGSWFLPTLEGEPRLAKPPLTAWITAMFVHDSTVSALDQIDPVNRARAYQTLARDVRIPAILCGALTLLATAAFARTIGPLGAAWIAPAVCASNLFFLRLITHATTDVQLMLWVTAANALLAAAIFNGWTWPVALACGAAIGLAFMSKGPVALVQSVLPAAAFAGFRRFANSRGESRANFFKIAAAAIVALLVGLTWFILVAQRDPTVIHRWLSETNPSGGERISHSNPLQYLVLVPLMLPWIFFFLDGLIRGLRNIKRDDPLQLRAAYPAFFLVVAMVVMSCFHDRKDRYILPLVPIASIVVAQSIAAAMEANRRSWLFAVHWFTLALAALLPILGATHWLKSANGSPWFSPTFAAIGVCAAGAIVVATFFFAQRRAGAIVVGTFALMLFLHAIILPGYARSPAAASEMRPLAEHIRRDAPAALLYNYRPDGIDKRASVDLSIYLNRITKWIPGPAQLPRAAQPQIYLTLQQAGEPQPIPLPGWRYFDKAPHDKDWYVAFERIED